ncbi:DUF1569 domain-containing protein [Flagellimonas algicola]|uniref:DUF1569 domain-containing protein n=1 Tax=Flagellimonas algicola TaxID=2583815 RepID=A0ABY2WKP1_9FLAO|nr:DUF1569 domain-containing protein [Allomuricauda algicola]TMU55391.1 DUF1569 domain-containing protein [Allomuricauda algicola]
MAKDKKSHLSFLDPEFSKIASYISHRDAINPKVSKVDVAWHLDHMLKTVIVICKSLEASKPEEYKSNFNFTRTVIYAWGDFPRGVAKSPRVVRPPDVILTEDLHLQIAAAKEGLKTIQELDENAHFDHPYFSKLNKKQSIRFLKIHTRHHLKIVRDIIKKS